MQGAADCLAGKLGGKEFAFGSRWAAGAGPLAAGFLFAAGEVLHGDGLAVLLSGGEHVPLQVADREAVRAEVPDPGLEVVLDVRPIGVAGRWHGSFLRLNQKSSQSAMVTLNRSPADRSRSVELLLLGGAG